MNQKIGPFVLLGSLFIVLVFILGVRYGKHVEKTDKVIAYVLSITPTKTPEPTKPASYLTFLNKGCGVQFLYPEILKVDKNGTAEASLKEGSAEAVQLSCEKNNEIQKIVFSSDSKIATEEVKFKAATIKARTDQKNSSSMLYFQIRNPQNGKMVSVAILKNYFPLFASTLQYIP